MRLVTIHLEAGQTPQALLREIQQLNGGQPVRTVSGRFGVLIDAELAYRYLEAQYGPPPPPASPPAEQVVVAAQEPKPKPPTKSRAKPKKAAQAAADKSEEV